MERGERSRPKEEPERIKQPDSVEELNLLLEKYKSNLVDDRKAALIRAIKKGEARLVIDPDIEEDQLVREVVVSTICILCKTSDGRVFKLEEGIRATASEGHSHLDLKNRKIQPFKTKTIRSHKDLSETARAFAGSREVETPFEGAVRGVMEEAFLATLHNEEREDDKQRCEDFVREKLRSIRLQLNHRAKDDPDNSYEGLRSKIQDHGYLLEIDQDAIAKYGLPITFDEAGNPNVLYETDTSEDGSVKYNEFVWRQIDEKEYKQVIQRQVSIRDEQGEIKTDPREALKQIIRDDNKYGKDSNEARKAVLDLSDIEVETWEAFVTNPDWVGLKWPETKFITEEINNGNYEQIWTESRKRFHRRMIRDEQKQVIEFSRRLDYGEPTVIILRGNTGSGKTRFLRSGYFDRPKAVRRSEKLGTVRGVINPDTYKGHIKEETSVRLTPSQLRTEGNMLSRFMEDWAISVEAKKTELEEEIEEMTTIIFDTDPNFSVAFDKRFGTLRELHAEGEGKFEILDFAEKIGRRTYLIDIDTPVEQSLLWMFTRPVDGFESRVPFEDIKNGFVANRINRERILGFIKGRDWLQYRPFITDDKGELIEVTDLSDPKQFELFNQARAVGTSEEGLRKEVDDIGNQKIKDLVKVIRKKYAHLGSKSIEIILGALESYQRIYGEDVTLRFAVDDHAKKKAF